MTTAKDFYINDEEDHDDCMSVGNNEDFIDENIDQYDMFRTIRGTENSRLANQKQAITILKATEAAILESGSELTPNTYFSALFPLLDDESKDAAMKNDENRIIEFNVAICYLLSFVFPRLEQSFIQEIYASGGMYATLSHSMRRFRLIAPFIRSVSVLVGCVLAAHREADWKEEQSSLGELFVILLGWSVDSRPKVRKMSQEAISNLLLVSPQAIEFTTEFIASVLLNSSRKDSTAAIQTFPLLRLLLPSIRPSFQVASGLDNLVTGLLNCLNLGNTHLSCAAYEIIQSYAQEQVEIFEESLVEDLDMENFGKIYGIVKRIGDGMLKHKPAVELVELTVGFLNALAQISLLTIRFQQALSKDPTQVLQVTLQIILSEYFLKSTNAAVLNASGSALLAMFFGLFDRLDAIKWSRNQSLLKGIALPILLAPEVANVIIPTQGRQLQDVTIHTRFAAFLPILSRMTETLGVEAIDSIGTLLVQVARLHDCRYLNCRDELIRVVSALIRVAGLPAVLQLLPLNLIKKVQTDEAPRAWILPLMRDHSYNTSLKCWLDVILPMSAEVSQRAENFRLADKINECRVWETLNFQLQTLLPAILSSFPVDFSDNFPKMSELIARMLNDNAQLRPTLMAALLRFIQNSQAMLESKRNGGIDEIGLLRPLTIEQIEADLAALTTAMPQFLPVLFNIYAATTTTSALGPTGNDDDDDDSAAASSDLTLKLIETLLGLTEDGVVADYFSKTVMRIERMRDSGSWAMLGTVLELSGTMIPHASAQSLISSFIPAVLPLLAAVDGSISLQKKTYRVLVRALSREDVRASFIGSKDHRDALFNTLTGSYESLHSAAKKMRFRLLALLAPELPDECLLWIPQFLPEVLIGVKEVNHRTRTQTYELLVTWGRRMSLGGDFVGFDGAMRQASLQEYIMMVLAGLAGNTPHMISATIMALARIIFEFAPALKSSDDGLVSTLTGDICLLLQSPSREIVKSAISFVKVALVVLDSETLDPLLANMTTGLLQWATVHHHQFKLQVRHLMERLSRRFGFERMIEVTPEEHHPLLVNIKKRREKSKKQKKDKPESDSSNDRSMENEIAATVSASKAALSRASKRNQFLMDDEEGNGSANRGGLLSNRARFEHALNDSGSDCDYEDEPEGGNNAAGNDDDNDDDKISTALSKKLTLKTSVTLKSAMSQRLPNMSRKQQDKLKRDLYVQEQQQKQLSKKELKRRRNDMDSDNEDDGDDDGEEVIRFGTDGKMRIGMTKDEQENQVGGDMDKVYRAAMSSFKHSADGKHVKFARGTKANNRNDDFDDDGDDHEDRQPKNRQASRSISGISGASRKSSLTTFSSRTGGQASSTVSRAHSGAQYRAKKGAAGDAKRKDSQFDPYAYVPIQRKSGKHGGKKENSNDRYFMKNNKRARK